MDPLRDIALAQVLRARELRERTTTELQLLMHRALSADDVHKALLKESPVLNAIRRLDLAGPDPVTLREEAAAAGVLDASPEDLTYRKLFPALDLGVYCANHSVGKPSRPARAAMDQFFAQQAVFGVDGFMEAGWLDLVDDARYLVGGLCGDPRLEAGDVTWFMNLSDGLSAVLSSLRGRLVTTAAHFTTGHYIHDHWARQTGSPIVIVPQDAQECVPTQAVIDALTNDTAIVSLSQVHWRSGYVHDLDAISEAMAATCPDAVLLLDVYQGHGTVPVSYTNLPTRTAILGGGLKQLHAGTGTGYAWLSHALLADLKPDRTGWWAHAEPIHFEDLPMRWAEGAGKLRTGSPALLPLVMLSTELKLLAASGGGTVQGGVERARHITRALMARAAERLITHGVTVRGPMDPERRGAFLAAEVEDGPTVLDRLSIEGITCDFRADTPGGAAGLIRLSAGAANFAYEIDYACDTLIAATRG